MVAVNLPVLSNLITSSRERCLRACPQKHYYAYEIGLRPTVAAPPLRFGTAIHGAIEAWENGSSPLDWLDDNADFEPYVMAKLRALMRGYVARWEAEPSWTREGGHTEASLYANIPNPESGRESRVFTQGGKVDQIVRLNDGRLAMVETKTTGSNIDDDRYWDALLIDAQVSTYYLLARANGFPIETCIYNVLHKPKIEPVMATPIENRKYRKDGALYASQRDTDETPTEYEERLVLDMAERPDFYFARREIPRLDADLARFMRDRWDTGQMILYHRANNRWPRNDKACFDFMRRCEYWGICTGMIEWEAGGACPPGFEMFANVHPELESEDDDDANGQAAAE